MGSAGLVVDVDKDSGSDDRCDSKAGEECECDSGEDGGAYDSDLDEDEEGAVD